MPSHRECLAMASVVLCCVVLCCVVSYIVELGCVMLCCVGCDGMGSRLSILEERNI